MAPEVRLVAFDVAVVGREVDAHVDHVVQRERREDRQVVGGDIVDRRAGDGPAAAELGAVLVERGDHLRRHGRVGFEPQREPEDVNPGEQGGEVVVAAVEGALVVGVGVVELDLGPGVGGDVVVEVGGGGELWCKRDLELPVVPALLVQKGGNDSLTFPIKVLRRVMRPFGETPGLVRYHLHHDSLHSYFVNVFRKLAKLVTI